MLAVVEMHFRKVGKPPFFGQPQIKIEIFDPLIARPVTTHFFKGAATNRDGWMD